MKLSAKTMRCYLIRHADKEKGDYYNALLRHQDEPISQRGRQQAQKLVSFFIHRPISDLYVSGYQRTQQTAEFVAQELGLIPKVDERLNEIDNGRIEGMTNEQIQSAFPEVWQGFQARSADFRFPDGETGLEAQVRIVDFLHEKRLQHQDSDILLISHDDLIRMVMCTIIQLPVYARWNFHFDFCGITEIVAQSEPYAWKLIRFNQTIG